MECDRLRDGCWCSCFWIIPAGSIQQSTQNCFLLSPVLGLSLNGPKVRLKWMASVVGRGTVEVDSIPNDIWTKDLEMGSLGSPYCGCTVSDRVVVGAPVIEMLVC